MKLYYSPGACSIAAHIALRQAGIPFELVQVNLMTKSIVSTGHSYLHVHPMGQVPALELDDGTVLTEGPAIAQYIADLVPQSKLAPPMGTRPRYALMSLLNFISTELHKEFAPLFHPQTPAAYKDQVRVDLRAVEYVASLFKDGRSYLSGEEFTVADAYLFAVLRLCGQIDIDLRAYPALVEWMLRVRARLPVQHALAAEGLALE